MTQIAKETIHGRVVDACRPAMEDHASFTDVPFWLRLAGLGEVVFYAFTLTSPTGGRPIGEYKIQLIVPHQPRRRRGSLYIAPGAFTILLGWSEVEGVFSMWDAYAHHEFAYSQNLQIKGECIWQAQVKGLSTCERRLRNGKGVETVVVCAADRLLDGIGVRMRKSVDRLSSLGSALG